MEDLLAEKEKRVRGISERISPAPGIPTRSAGMIRRGGESREEVGLGRQAERRKGEKRERGRASPPPQEIREERGGVDPLRLPFLRQAPPTRAASTTTSS